MQSTTVGSERTAEERTQREILELRLSETASPWDRLPILIGLAEEPTRNDPEFGLTCAKEALVLARQINDRYWIAHSLLRIGIRIAVRQCYSETLSYLEEASRIFADLNDPTGKARTDVYIARTHLFMGEFDPAMNILAETIPICRDVGDMKLLAIALSTFGDGHKWIGDHANGLRYYRRSLRIIRSAGIDSQLGYAYQDLGLAYRQIGEAKRALRYLRKSLAAHRRHEYQSGMAVALSNIGRILMEEGEDARAERYVWQARRLYRKLGYVAYEANAWGRLSVISTHLGERERAYGRFRRGLAIARKSESRSVFGRLYQAYGNACLQDGRPDDAIRYLRRGLRAMESSGFTHYRYELHRDLATAYEAADHHAKALEHHKSYVALRDEYVNSGKGHEAGRAEMLDRLSRLRDELTRERTNVSEARQTVERQRSELTAMALRLAEGNSCHDAGTSKRAERDNWDIFASRFHKIHPEFYTTLIRRFPDLTPTEVRVCSLIRIGLTSKEIASILSVSKRTVDSHREHINGKLNPPVRLAAFLAAV